MEIKLNFELPNDVVERICSQCMNRKRICFLPAVSSNSDLNDPLPCLSILAENINQLLLLKDSHIISITQRHSLPLHKAFLDGGLSMLT